MGRPFWLDIIEFQAVLFMAVFLPAIIATYVLADEFSNRFLVFIVCCAAMFTFWLALCMMASILLRCLRRTQDDLESSD